ncbi:MAG: hypothetical protein A2W30_06765 [Ignavibacteria bacterium RBG_16_36_9]|nr:MAG: hypothetical protein A2W30_06765 [Ignavibacteria bacterium RBG_16_36_9]
MLFRKKTKIKRPLFRRIINYFLGAGIGLIVILLTAFGYTQTSSFRNWLKDFVIEQVNTSTNGKLAIEELDGTIFTSLILSNTSYVFEKDTFFSAEKIELKVSPLKIFLKTIYVRKLEIENAEISLLKDENGVLNLSKITTPSEEEEIKDLATTTEPFNWKIDVSNLKLKNINFRQQTLANKNSTAYYPQPEMDDFRLENLNLSLNANVDIAANEYQLYISEFSVKPNLTGFKLLNLSGNFVLLKDMAGITDLKIITERSFISLNAAASDFYLFSEEGINLENSPVKIELSAMNFDFDDLTNFIDGTNILKGGVETHLSAEGTLSELELKNLEVKLANTNLNATGYLQNILDGGEMNINVSFRNSFINQDDVTALLPTLEIPTYKEYGVLQFDSLAYEGQPLNFASNMLLETDQGNISGTVKMDLRGEEILYNYQIKTANLNLMPLAGINTNLNLNSNLKGKGFSPENLETSIQLNADASTIEGIFFSDFSIAAEGSKGIINTNVVFTSLETQGRLNTDFNFTDSTLTKYNFDVLLTGFNINDFAKESGINSELNISLKGDGENFDLDKLNLFAVLEIDSSKLNDIQIDSTTLIADIRSSDENRVINIISDLADLTITGEFTLLEVIDVVADETSLIFSSIQKKIEQIQPPDFIKSGLQTKPDDSAKNITALPTNRSLNIQYLLELKSFELLSLFLGDAEIEVDGEITGKLLAAGDTTILTIDTKINQMKYWDGLELFYLSDFDFAMRMNNRSSADSFDGFMADMKVDAKRIFVGSEITDLSFDMNFDGSDAQIDLSAVYETDTRLDLEGSLFINDGFVDVLFDKLFFKYYGFDLHNSGDIRFSYSEDKINFDTLSLIHNGGKLDLGGQLSFTGNEDLTLKLSNFKLKDLNANLMGLSPEKSFDGELNLDFAMTGTAENPIINLSYSIDSIKAQNLFLGSVESKIQYSEKLLNVDLSLLETKNSQSRSSLDIKGTLPIDLAFYSEERFVQDKTVDMTLVADNFDLRFASGLIPGIRNLNGLMNGNINFNGPHNDLRNSGELTIGNSSFVLAANNLTYLLDAKINFENNKIVLSNLNLKNEPDIKDGGTMTAKGEFVLRNFEIESINLNASGALKLLDERSRAADPSLYGDITVRTRNEIVFTSSESRSYLKADLILARGASITYSPTQSAFANENDKFTYIFKSVGDQDVLKKEIDSLIQVAELKKVEIKKETIIPFDLDLKIQVENEVKVVFVLSREFKQNLTTYLGGNFEYTVANNVPFTRGELVLLDGSKLDLIKTFQAEGNLKFLDEIDNPYVNVVATYESYYSPDTLRTGANEYDIQVRIRVEGPVKSITTNFLQDENNISVYRSRRNANQFELDATKTASDAIFFIMVNKFPEDASLQESNFAASTAASLAGSIVGSVLNEKLGDVVRSVNVQQVGAETVFSLIGRVGNFRYEIGGTSQVFQDFSRANVKIEHPLYFPNLIIRFDRKEPAYQSSTYSEMINELGLKYSFVF